MFWLGTIIGLLVGGSVGALIVAFFSSNAYSKGLEDGRRAQT